MLLKRFDGRCPARALRTAPALLATAAALAAAGCASSSAEIGQAVSAATRAAHAVTQLSENALRSWCPQAVAAGGSDLTQAEARGCLQRAWDGWMNELKRHGYNPQEAAQGK
jgi:type IV pilus biogenesis protein CpaD/CtpE